MLPKLKPEENAGAVPEAGAELKSDGELPNADVLFVLKSDGELLVAPNAGADPPNIDGDEFVPKGFELDVEPKGEEPNAGVEDVGKLLPKAGVFAANGLELVGAVDVKRPEDDWPKVFDPPKMLFD